VPDCRRRNIGARRPVGSHDAQEQLKNRGVYINVFEQSILTDNRPNKPWSLLASLSAELLVVSVMILIPLFYGDHLPDFHWRIITLGPPVRRVEPRPAPVQPASGAARIVFQRPPLISNPIQAAQTSPAAYASVAIDQPPGLQGIATDGGIPGPALFGKAIDIAPPVHRSERSNPPSGPVRVSQGVQMAKLVKQVIPTYPQLAKNARIYGVVHLVGIIGKDGAIRNLQLISGHPLLAKAALDAVAQWVYQPTLLSGEAVEVICPIDVNFTLSQ
jgi:periplasmic protein TonB